MKKSLTKQLNDKKLRIEQLEKELKEVKEDREKFRTFWRDKMRWFIELHGSKQIPVMSLLIEDMAKFFNRVQHWYW